MGQTVAVVTLCGCKKSSLLSSSGGKSHVTVSIDCLHRSGGEIGVKEKFILFLYPQNDNQQEANTGVWVSL